MSAYYRKNNSNSENIGPKEESDINILTALELSEFLKPEALQSERTLSDEVLFRLQEALPVVMEDAEKYRRKAEELSFRRLNTMGVKVDRLFGDNEGFDLKEEEGGPARQRGFTGVTAGFDNMLDAYIRITETCVESIKNALHTHIMSLFDIERIPRYLSMLSQNVVREGLENEYQKPSYLAMASSLTNEPKENTNAKKCSEAAKAVDAQYGKEELYVVSRRLLDKYSAPDTLEEMDGWIKTNAVTSKKKDVSLFNGVDTTTDPKTGVRILTKKGKLNFRALFSSAMIERGMALSPKAKSSFNASKSRPGAGNYINVAMDPGDRVLLTKAISDMATKSRSAENLSGPDSATEKFAETVSNVIGFRRPVGQETPEVKRNRLLGNMDKIIYCGYRGMDSGVASGIVKQGLERLADVLSPSNMSATANRQEQLPELMERHITHAMLKEIYQNTKSGIISNGVKLSYESDRTMEKDTRTEFPFVDDSGKDVNPFATVHPGKLATLCTEMDLALLRLNALPVEMVGQETGTGMELTNRISELKTRCIKISATARKELEDFLGMNAEDAAGMIEKAISDAKLRVDRNGWFMDGKNGVVIKDSRKILGKALKQACMSFRIPEEYPDVLLTAAMEYIKADSGVPAPSGSRTGKGKQEKDGGEEKGMGAERTPWTDPETGEVLIEPPKTFGDSTPATRFALLAGLPVDSTVDAAVPEGVSAYYADPDGSETSANMLLNQYGDLNPDYEKSGGASPEMLYNDVKSFIQACASASTALGIDRPDPAERFLQQAETQAKALYVKEWKTVFAAMKDAWALCYQDTDATRSTLVETYSKAGKDYGESLIRVLSANILQEAGLAKDAERLKTVPDDMGDAARYTCRHLAVSVIDSTIDKIARDMTYAEGMNSQNTDWNRWQDYVKEDSRYDALMKSTMPVFVDDLILNSFLKRSNHPEELMSAARLSENTKYGQEAIGRFAELIKAEENRAVISEEMAEKMYDPDTNNQNAKRLCLSVCTVLMDPNAKKEALDSLAALEANNPDGAETYGHLRDIISSPDFRYGTDQYRECLGIISDGRLEHLSPGARLNPHLPAEVLRAKDIAWSAKRRSELLAKASDIRMDSAVTAEERARIDAAFATVFSPAASGARYLSRFGSLADQEGLAIGNAIEETMTVLAERSGEDLERSFINEYGNIAARSTSLNNDNNQEPASLHTSVALRAAPDVTGEYGIGTKCPRVFMNADDNNSVSDINVSNRRVLVNIRDSGLPAVLDMKRCSNKSRSLVNMYSGIGESHTSAEGWKTAFRNNGPSDPFRKTIETVREYYKNESGITDRKGLNKVLVDKVKELQNPDPVVSGRVRKELSRAFMQVPGR